MNTPRPARLSFLLAIAAALAGCAQLPQTPPPGVSATATAPALKAGDTWTYAVHDGYTKLPRGTIRHTVTTVDAGKIVLAVEQTGGPNVGCRSVARDNSLDKLPDNPQTLCVEAAKRWELTPGGAWLRHPLTNGSTYTFSPAYQAYAFPLAAGKSWNGRVISHDLATGRDFDVTYSATVTGWERVTVPAGEFDTLVIERAASDGYWDYTRGQSEIREWEWFAPALGRAVRKEGRSEFLEYMNCGLLRGCPFHETDNWLVYELLPPAKP
jgi:hypothetical protein